jgi:hypothetical protein
MKGRFFLGLILGVLITVGIRAFDVFDCLQKTGDQLIFVGPDASQVSKPKAALSLGRGNKATWQSTDGQALGIEFKKADLPKDSKGNPKPPFQGMKDCADSTFLCFDCKASDECRSGPLNPDLKENVGILTCVTLKYYQRLGGKQADGWIIIKP